MAGDSSWHPHFSHQKGMFGLRPLSGKRENMVKVTSPFCPFLGLFFSLERMARANALYVISLDSCVATRLIIASLKSRVKRGNFFSDTEEVFSS